MKKKVLRFLETLTRAIIFIMALCTSIIVVLSIWNLFTANTWNEFNLAVYRLLIFTVFAFIFNGIVWFDWFGK